MNDIINKINYCRENYKPMGHKRDLFYEYFILKEHNPNKIIEIGAGAAGWALTMNDLLDNNTLEFELIENFCQTNYTGFEWWPKNKIEFSNYILEKNKNLKYSLKEKYSKIDNGDVLRFDAWGFSLQEIESILNDLSENAIIIFDDFSFNKDLDLIILVLELAKKNLIYPIWASNTVSGWSKSKNYSKKMISYLEKNKTILNNVTNETVCYKKFTTVLNIDFQLVQFK
jgi:hypothetical protein